MPLHGNSPPTRVFAFDTFDDSIGRASRDSQSRRRFENTLVMKGIDLNSSFSNSCCNTRSRLDGDLVRAHVANIVYALRVVIERARHARRDVLDECSTERDVEQLRSAADCEERLSHLARSLHKRYFSFVATTVHRAQALVGSLTIKLWVDIFSSREYEAVDGFNDASRCSR